ncbi:hypothetical protein ACFQFR_30010 [Streptomyces goshikiensis]
MSIDQVVSIGLPVNISPPPGSGPAVTAAETREPLPFGARLLKGERNWWFLGPGGVARLRDRHVTADGGLRPDAEQRLHESGMFTPAGSAPTR